MALSGLEELDSVEILVIIDNELDPISPCPSTEAQYSGGIREIAFRNPAFEPAAGGGPIRELKMEEICCSAHGLSLMITGVIGEQRHTILFDAGPEGRAFELNAKRLRADLGAIETIQLSHWHRDHSGGIETALELIGEARAKEHERKRSTPVTVDLHPNRPELRGVHAPGLERVALSPDPTFEEIEKAGGQVIKDDHPHVVLDGMFAVSGEIPRLTEYERGMKFGARLSKGEWVEDELLMDERLLMCKVKDKGVVVFTGCSHAGVVNASRHAVELSGGAPLYAVMGGYHLADAECTKIQSTVADLKALDAQFLLTGHCTGWRAKFEVERQMPGRLVPSFVGSKFVFSRTQVEDEANSCTVA
ncbi:hypothetical protein AC579_1010 [Pseudocercospora musae]|uniref:Metallo-beta-lactamase domain-containing protein n=1 Tax=Pseudocercospora musae TaxID=113226 RepID=A0A139IBA1_9PEZI|nr:hypothetical protein AC579_1010 [Pseudocercospora musae]